MKAMKLPHNTAINPYVARTLFRIDRVIYALKGQQTYWNEHLCIPYFRDGTFTHASAVRSHFPSWCFTFACRLYRIRPFWIGRLFYRMMNL